MAFQLLWPGELLQSVTVTIKVSWVWVVWGVEGHLLWPGDLLQSATVTIKVHRRCWGGGGSPALGTGGQVSMSLTAVTVASQFLWPGVGVIRGWWSCVNVTGLPAPVTWRPDLTCCSPPQQSPRSFRVCGIGAGLGWGVIRGWWSSFHVTVVVQLLWPGDRI